MAQFDVTAVTKSGSGGGPSQMMPLQRNNSPIAEGHTLVSIIYPWSCPTGSTYSTTFAQVPHCCPALVGHSAQSWTSCAPLLCGSKWSSTKQPSALFSCISGTQNWWTPFGWRLICKTTQETRNDSINMLMSCVCLLCRVPQSLLALSLVFMLHYHLGF